MPKTAVNQWSSTASANTDINGINIAEGAPAKNLNDAIREVMAQVKTEDASKETRIASLESDPPVAGALTRSNNLNDVSDADASLANLGGGTAGIEAFKVTAPESLPGVIDYKHGGTGGVVRTLQSRLQDVPDIRDWGAVGNNVTDDAAAVQAAVDYMESVGGGELHVSQPGTYVLSSEILIQKPVMLLCAGYGEDGNNAAGDNTRLVNFRRAAAGAAAPMFRFQSATSGQVIRGGGIKGAMLNGNDIATIGVHARSTQFQHFDIATWSMVNSGIRLDGGNTALSGFNHIWLHFVYGTGATPANAHGLHLRGEDGAGCTRNTVHRLNGLHDDGHLLFCDGFTDNNEVLLLNAARQSGGTGYGAYFGAGASADAQQNRIFNHAGHIYAESGTFGNQFIGLTSEATSLTLQDATAKVDFVSLIDYANGKAYSTAQYDLRQEIPIVNIVSSASYATAGTLWTAPALGDAGSNYIYGVAPPSRNRGAGTLTGLKIGYFMGTANTSKDVRLTVVLETATPGTAANIADLNESFTVRVGDAVATYNESTLTFGTPLAIAEGDTILFRMERAGADAADNATGNMLPLSATLLYESNGPANGGSPWNIPV